MSTIDDRLRQLIEANRRAEELLEQHGDRSHLHGGGGGGTSGGVEARITRLESDMEHVKRSLDRVDGGVADLKKTVNDLKVDSGRVDERTKHFPTRTELLATAAVMIAILAGIMALIVRFLPSAS